MDGLKKRILTCPTSRLTNLRRAVLGTVADPRNSPPPKPRAHRDRPNPGGAVASTASSAGWLDWVGANLPKSRNGCGWLPATNAASFARDSSQSTLPDVSTGKRQHSKPPTRPTGLDTPRHTAPARPPTGRCPGSVVGP